MERDLFAVRSGVPKTKGGSLSWVSRLCPFLLRVYLPFSLCCVCVYVCLCGVGFHRLPDDQMTFTWAGAGWFGEEFLMGEQRIWRWAGGRLGLKCTGEDDEELGTQAATPTRKQDPLVSDTHRHAGRGQEKPKQTPKHNPWRRPTVQQDSVVSSSLFKHWNPPNALSITILPSCVGGFRVVTKTAESPLWS